MSKEIITFGCRLNQYESEVIKKMLENSPVENESVIVHTCAVTKEAERQVKQKIRALHRANPETKIVVVGCAVDINSDEYSAMPGVVKVLRNKEKLHATNYTNDKVITMSNSVEHTPISNFDNQTRAFVKIQDGCNHSCTFCSITTARGESRSLSVDNVLSNIGLLVENGHKEVIFTGVNITDFGKDTADGSNLCTLIRRTLAAFPELKRLRLSSVDIADVDDLLIDVMTSQERFMPHLHLSLQSGSNMILQRMRRRHSREEAIDTCKKITANRAFTFGVDIIAGFPTETDEMFAQTADIFTEIPIIHAHIFPYSQRPDTPAARMPQQIDLNTKKRRAAALKTIATNNLSMFCSSIVGTEQKVLVENDGGGHTENMVYVKLEASCPAGEIVPVKITSAHETYIMGNVI